MSPYCKHKKSDKRQARIKKKFGEIKPKDEIEKPKFMIKVSSILISDR